MWLVARQAVVSGWVYPKFALATKLDNSWYNCEQVFVPSG